MLGENTLEKLDLKDRKILYQLDLNCRQSNTQIGKKIGLKKDVVGYRIKRMEEAGVIKGYWTNIDSYKFGYEVYRYYIVFQNVTSDIKNEIIEQLINYKNTWVVRSIKGLYDISLVLWVDSIPKFYSFWDEFNEKYGDYFAEKIFSVYLQDDAYPLSYLLLEEYEKSDRDKCLQTTGGEPVEIDDVDYKLLNYIVENARIPLIELAEKLGCSSQAANYRIKNLMKKRIIQAFRVNIDVSKLGLQEFKVDIWLKKLSKRKQIWNCIKYNPYVTFISTSAGYADLEIVFTTEDSDKLIEILEDVFSKFPGAVRKYIYWASKKTYKFRCMPEIDFKSILCAKKNK